MSLVINIGSSYELNIYPKIVFIKHSPNAIDYILRGLGYDSKISQGC